MVLARGSNLIIGEERKKNNSLSLALPFSHQLNFNLSRKISPLFIVFFLSLSLWGERGGSVCATTERELMREEERACARAGIERMRSRPLLRKNERDKERETRRERERERGKE